MAQLNLGSRKIRCLSLAHGGIYFAASLPVVEEFPSQAKAFKGQEIWPLSGKFWRSHVYGEQIELDGSGQHLCSTKTKHFWKTRECRTVIPCKIIWTYRMVGEGCNTDNIQGKGTVFINLHVSNRYKPAAGLYGLGTLPHCSRKPWAVPTYFPVVSHSLATAEGNTQHLWRVLKNPLQRQDRHQHEISTAQLPGRKGWDTSAPSAQLTFPLQTPQGAERSLTLLTQSTRMLPASPGKSRPERRDLTAEQDHLLMLLATW